MTTEELTLKAIACLRRGSDVYRDSLLECGGYCYEILRASSENRHSYGARKALATRLSESVGQSVDVYRLVTCNRVVALMGNESGLGTIGIAAIRAFYPCIRRVRTPAAPGSLKRDQGRKAKSEEYELVPAMAEAGRLLFSRAVRERLTLAEITEAVETLSGRSLRRIDKHTTRNNVHLEESNPLRSAANRQSRDIMLDIGKRSAPKDLVEMIVDMIFKSDQKEQVAVLLKKEMDTLLARNSYSA